MKSINNKIIKKFIQNHINHLFLIIILLILVISTLSFNASNSQKQKSFNEFIPKAPLPYDLYTDMVIYSYDTDFNSTKATIKYKTNLSYYPIYLISHKFENEEKSKTNYNKVINTFQKKIPSVKFELNETISKNDLNIQKYSMELSGNIRNNMYSWQDSNFVFITMGPYIDNKNMPLELINKIYE